MRRTIRFDVYKLWESNQRINSELVNGGYDNFETAAKVAANLTKLYSEGPNLRPRVFTVRICGHTDSLYMRDKHTPLDVDIDALRKYAT